MADKLNLMDSFPNVALKLTNGSQIVLPEAIQTDYAVVLFYRGHW